MAGKKVIRPCSAHKEWDKMTVDEKVETLATWAVQMEDWAVKMGAWTGNVKEVMLTLGRNAGEVQQATLPFSQKDGNGGPPPPKSPKDPGC